MPSVTNVVKFILDLLSKSSMFHFNRFMHFVDYELSQKSQLRRRQELQKQMHLQI